MSEDVYRRLVLRWFGDVACRILRTQHIPANTTYTCNEVYAACRADLCTLLLFRRSLGCHQINIDLGRCLGE